MLSGRAPDQMLEWRPPKRLFGQGAIDDHVAIDGGEIIEDFRNSSFEGVFPTILIAHRSTFHALPSLASIVVLAYWPNAVGEKLIGIDAGSS